MAKVKDCNSIVPIHTQDTPEEESILPVSVQDQKQGRPSKYPAKLTIFVSQETYDMVVKLQGVYRESRPNFLRRTLEAGIFSISREVSEELETLKKSLSQWNKSRE